MRRPLIKMYIIIAAAFLTAVFLVPQIVNRTSSAAVFTVTQADIMIYNARTKKPPVPPDKEKAYAVFIMDDGWKSQYEHGYRILSKYGMKGCIAVAPTLIDEEGYMSFGELAEIYMSGWDLLNHTYDHKTLSLTDKYEQADQLMMTRDWLKKHRFNSGMDIVIYPGGAFTEETQIILEENRFTAGISLKSVWDARLGSFREDIEIYNFISSASFSDARAAIDKAISSKNTVLLMLHKIEPITEDSCMKINENMLEQIARYLDENNERISVVTMTELLGS